jgi:hypothetical protein
MPHACSAHDIAESVKQQLVDSAWHRPPPLPRQEPVSTHTNVQVTTPLYTVTNPIFYLCAAVYLFAVAAPTRPCPSSPEAHIATQTSQFQHQKSYTAANAVAEEASWKRRRRGGVCVPCVARCQSDFQQVPTEPSNVGYHVTRSPHHTTASVA